MTNGGHSSVATSLSLAINIQNRTVNKSIHGEWRWKNFRLKHKQNYRLFSGETFQNTENPTKKQIVFQFDAISYIFAFLNDVCMFFFSRRNLFSFFRFQGCNIQKKSHQKKNPSEQKSNVEIPWDFKCFNTTSRYFILFKWFDAFIPRTFRLIKFH